VGVKVTNSPVPHRGITVAVGVTVGVEDGLGVAVGVLDIARLTTVSSDLAIN
jgi:hypothetical protein